MFLNANLTPVGTTYASRPPAGRIADITDIYQRVLGRDPDPAGLQNWLNSGLWPDQMEEQIRNSPEGVAYQKRKAFMLYGAVAAAVALLYFMSRKR